MTKTFRSFADERKVIAKEASALGGRVSGQAAMALQERRLVLDQLELHGAHLDYLEERMAVDPALPANPWPHGFGKFLQAVREAGSPDDGRVIDARLSTRAALGMNESVPSDGGFLVPSSYANDLLDRALYESRVASLCSRFPITKGNKLLMPVADESSRANGARFGGVYSTWQNEADTAAATKPKVRMLDLELQKLLGFVWVTDELLADALTLGRFVTKAFTEETAFRLDDAVLNGSGTGQPLGFLNAPGLYTVAKESGQTSGTIVENNIFKMWSHMLARSKANSAWLISDDVETAFYSAGLPAGFFSPPDGNEPYGRLMGRPVIPIEQAAPIGTLGDITLADLSDYVLTDRAIETAVSMHVRFLFDESVFRFSYRVDGQPSLRTPITPFLGAGLKSAYVALQAR
jgi:HK97 family phage major capsid protein